MLLSSRECFTYPISFTFTAGLTRQLYHPHLTDLETKAQRLSLVQSHTLGKKDPSPFLPPSNSSSPSLQLTFSCSSDPRLHWSVWKNSLTSFLSLSSLLPSPDRGIIMTFGSGSNGCLGHGSLNDISQVGFECILGRRKWGDGKQPTFES